METYKTTNISCKIFSDQAHALDQGIFFANFHNSNYLFDIMFHHVGYYGRQKDRQTDSDGCCQNVQPSGADNQILICINYYPGSEIEPIPSPFPTKKIVPL